MEGPNVDTKIQRPYIVTNSLLSSTHNMSMTQKRYAQVTVLTTG